jgi:predicted enzyme related to lactoylglutathione lyase
MSAAIVHFEIQVSDPEKAKLFYGEIFGWKIEKWEGTDFYGVWTGRSKYASGSVVGLDGGLGAKEGTTPSTGAALNAFLCTVEIEDIDDTLQRIDEAGGTILKPKYAFPYVGWMAICADPDGNQFALMQNDAGAK